MNKHGFLGPGCNLLCRWGEPGEANLRVKEAKERLLDNRGLSEDALPNSAWI